MPSTTVYNMAGEAVEQLELSEQVFGVIPNVAVLHQVVTAQLVNRRQGNASTKTRSEVSGGGKKPYELLAALARVAHAPRSSGMVAWCSARNRISIITTCLRRCVAWRSARLSPTRSP